MQSFHIQACHIIIMMIYISWDHCKQGLFVSCTCLGAWCFLRAPSTLQYMLLKLASVYREIIQANFQNTLYYGTGKKNKSLLTAISHCETLVEGSLHTYALAVEAIGAPCTRQFSRQVSYFIT